MTLVGLYTPNYCEHDKTLRPIQGRELTTLQLALVAKRIWVGVDWINGSIASLAISREVAIASIDSIKESVQETSAALEPQRIKEVIGLEQDTVLWIDDWVWSRCQLVRTSIWQSHSHEIWKSRSDSPPATAEGANPPSMPSSLGAVVAGIFGARVMKNSAKSSAA